MTTQFPCDGCGAYGGPAASYPPTLQGGIPYDVPYAAPPTDGSESTGTLPPGDFSNAGSGSAQIVPGQPVFSHTVGDRKLQPGETLKGEIVLPMESAAVDSANEKK